MQQSLEDTDGRLYAGNTHRRLHNDSADERLQGAAGPNHQLREHKHRTKVKQSHTVATNGEHRCAVAAMLYGMD